ncbi:sugar transport protein MST2-like [Lolium rigidum]|uniref:sugar transport protein MST2-like n=1 Tax=Lolium rigidum TaxID=89674 RepID=UPI001F5CC063|nr:sugar transport protein MST2-like [Lolium rigidum]
MPSRAMAASAAGDAKEYPGKLTLYVFLTCAVAATGGLIVGYDIGISGGVTSMDTFLEKFFPSVYHKEQMAHGSSSSQYCKFDSQLLTAFTSSLYLAALVASFFVASVARSFGRKWCMFAGGVSFLAGAALNAAAQNVAMLIVGHILLGVGVGFAGLSIPIYLSEMAPPRLRGTLNIGLQLMITVGIFSANLVNYGAAKIRGGWGWRVSLGLAAVPAGIITVGSLFLPDTPSSLISRGYHEQARRVLRRIRGTSDVADEYGDLAAATELSGTVKRPWRDILERRYRPQLTMAVLIPFFQQLTGINVIMFYAPVLFKTIGLGGDAALMTAVITGLVNIVATFVSIATVDRLGRRKLFFQGGAQMFVCQVIIGTLIGVMFHRNGGGGVPTTFAASILVFICVYVAGFAWSWGPLGILVPSEIFPLEIRPAGQGINVAVNMLCTFAVAQAFLPMLCHMRSGLFYLFGGWVLLMTAFVVLFLPETKNVPIEKMAVVWTTHWFWGSFVADQDSHVQVGHGEVDVATGKLNQTIV